MERKRYQAIDGLRIAACTGIVMMHIKANNAYQLSGFIFAKLIPSFTNFVFLFMVISAFGMCCGYFEKVINNQLSMEEFYIKRYKKILPFFAVLILMDIITAPSKSALIEGFADATLLFGLFPNDISVIGVGWFLGLIFAFYLIFPFYCVLIKNKKRAWGVFIISLILNYVVDSYWGLGRNNIVFSLCYFIAGGLVYLYRKEIEQFGQKYWWLFLGGVVLSIVLYFVIDANTLTTLLVSVTMLIFSLSYQWKHSSKFTQFFSSISMEVYLSHMVVFRIIEKLGLNRMIGNNYLQYTITTVVTLCGAIVFSLVVKKGIEIIQRLISRKKQRAKQDFV